MAVKAPMNGESTYNKFMVPHPIEKATLKAKPEDNFIKNPTYNGNYESESKRLGGCSKPEKKSQDRQCCLVTTKEKEDMLLASTQRIMNSEPQLSKAIFSK